MAETARGMEKAGRKWQGPWMRSIVRFVERRSGLIVLVALAVAAVASVGYSLYLGDSLRFPDERLYVQIADVTSRTGIYSADGIVPTAIKAPGYPLFLTFVALLSKDVAVFRLVNFALYCLSLILVYRLGKRVFSGWAGALAVLLCLSYPVLFFTASTLYPQTLASLLMLLYVSLQFTPGRLGVASAAAAGAVGGLTVLTVPLLVVIIALGLAWRGVSKKDWRGVIISAAVGGLMLLGWTLRNYQVFHRIVVISTDAGANLLIGNNPNAMANSGPTVDLTEYYQLAGESGISGEAEFNSFYTEQALAWMRENPAAALRLYAMKAANAFNYRNDLATSAEASPWRDLLALVSYGFLMALFVGRLLLAIRVKLTSLEGFILVSYIAFALVSAVFFTRIRYRVPLDYLLALFDAVFVYQLARLVGGLARRDGPGKIALGTTRSS